MLQTLSIELEAHELPKLQQIILDNHLYRIPSAKSEVSDNSIVLPRVMVSVCPWLGQAQVRECLRL